MLPLEFFIPGEVVSKGRPRFTREGRTYTPAKTARYEDLLKLAARDAMKGAAPVEKGVALAISVTAFLAVPASWSQKKRAAALLGDVRPTSRPDADNYLKIALDGLNEVAWADDSQIVRASVAKHYSNTPGLAVKVWSAA